ncbi:DUF885 family protein (plasmid) [Lichenicola cladoniae]|uniref:DUF885 family protein n=1 Tax=Lichenicola cladoniae TaxID=1484109 RepID=A0A6M8HY42_9PROT|nr:DUF885 family protein [Lichenicola cladoniae]NPD70142.1 DUF885 family protein [Acetobacteraceae bacterium]QKE93011.1 DUF885 family protein [Lichenicola cladoniae]
MSGPDGLGQAFLDHHLAFHPVDASFMGIGGYDHLLPRADSSVAADERRGIARLRVGLQDAPEDSPGHRIDKRIVVGELACADAALDGRPRCNNPAWFTGEAAFALIGLLLPQSAPIDLAAFAARLLALPDFLADGRQRLREAGAAPVGWCDRAARECRAMSRFLTADLPRHPAWRSEWLLPAKAAAASFEAFADMLPSLGDADPAAGRTRLAQIMAALHGLEQGPEALAAAAQAAFDRLGDELEADAARSFHGRRCQDVLDELAALHPDADGVMACYRQSNAAALDAARGLVTPATQYGLDYRLLPEAMLGVAEDLYFLSYRSPPAMRPGAGSVYWVTPRGPDLDAYLRQQNHATIKLIHAVHHGSIGHHTHNTRARAADSLLARIAGTDCASGIALLSGGMAVEGWACYAEDLLMEAPGFYSDAERLALKQYERRNAASVLVDIRLHCGLWSQQEAERFYRDEAGFAPARVHNELVRNSMFPGSRLMYWAGVEAIRALRARWTGTTLEFYDTLLSYGHSPVSTIEAEMARAGRIT